MAGQWSHRNPAVRRILQELREMEKEDDPNLLAEAIEVSVLQALQGRHAARASEQQQAVGGPQAAPRTLRVCAPSAPFFSFCLLLLAGEHLRVALCDSRSLGLGVRGAHLGWAATGRRRPVAAARLWLGPAASALRALMGQ